MDSQRHVVIPRVMCFVFTKEHEEIILMKASDDKDFAGMYDPPGGHIEKGESVIQAAKREILEETGITPESTALKGIIHVSDFFEKEIMLFVTKSVSEKNELSEHREGVPKWFSVNEIDQLDIIEDVKPILKSVLELKEGELLIGTSEFDGKDNLTGLNIAIS